MTPDQIRQIENYAIACPLSDIEDRDMLAFLGSLIQDHDHLREKLMTEPNRAKRREKYDVLKVNVKFTANRLESYELAELARANGVQPIYDEVAAMEKKRIWMPPSFVHEVKA